MTVRITIIGLGQIGASVGLALGSQAGVFERIGHDKDLGIARRAQKLGAVDQVAINLPASVQESDIVFLALPIDQVKDTLALIAQDLKENVVVMETGPAKEITAAWAGELLPEKRFYIGLTPVINPAYLLATDSGLDAARADLFQRGLMAIVSPPRTPSDAIKLAADLTRMLGADPMFADPLEMDGLMASTHVLPHLLSAAMVNATVDQPGWREARKVAGRAYAEVTTPAIQASGSQTLAKAALLNRENTLRSLDGIIAVLQNMRRDLDGSDESALLAQLERSRQGRENWWKERQAANWTSTELPNSMAQAPSGSDIFGRLLGIKKRKNNK